MIYNQPTEAPVKEPITTPDVKPKEPGVKKFPKVQPGPRA